MPRISIAMPTDTQALSSCTHTLTTCQTGNKYQKYTGIKVSHRYALTIVTIAKQTGFVFGFSFVFGSYKVRFNYALVFKFNAIGASL